MNLGPPPEMFLRMGESGIFKGTSELTVFHEMVHLLFWKNGTKFNHRALEEVGVLDEIWKAKDMWT
jgi:predicted SprT family Zn-dependent metalloprotease